MQEVHQDANESHVSAVWAQCHGQIQMASACCVLFQQASVLEGRQDAV